MGRRFILLWVVLAAPILAFSQTTYYGGVGYNASFVNDDGLNFVIQRYNDTRPFLVEKMEPFEVLHWPTAQLGVILDNGVTVEVTWVGRVNTSEAIGEGTFGARERWDVQIRDNSYGVLAGYTYNSPFVIKPGILFGLDMGQYKIFSRAGLATEIDQKDFKVVSREFSMGSTIAINILLKGREFPLAGAIRPYFHFDYVNQDFTSLNKAINPNTYTMDAEDKLQSKNNHFGLQAILIVTLTK